jgi:hypothetical protein
MEVQIRCISRNQQLKLALTYLIKRVKSNFTTHAHIHPNHTAFSSRPILILLLSTYHFIHRPERLLFLRIITLCLRLRPHSATAFEADWRMRTEVKESQSWELSSYMFLAILGVSRVLLTPPKLFLLSLHLDLPKCWFLWTNFRSRVITEPSNLME